MRNMTQAAGDQVQRQFGAEPIIVIGINISGNFMYFGDRDGPDFHGRIILVENLDNVINISQNAGVASVTVQFIDVDGHLKQLFDTHDLHKRPCRIYQYFPETDFTTDRILLFDGQLATPIIYDEARMSLTLTGLSKLEDIEVGFSPDNALWTDIIPNEIEPQAWPMPFGTPVNFPLPQITKEPYGSLIHGFGIPDISSPFAIHARGQFYSDLNSYVATTNTATGISLYQIEAVIAEIEALQERAVSIEETLLEISSELDVQVADINDKYDAQIAPDASAETLAGISRARTQELIQAYTKATNDLILFAVLDTTAFTSPPVSSDPQVTLNNAINKWSQATSLANGEVALINEQIANEQQYYAVLVQRRQKYEAERTRAMAAAAQAGQRLAEEQNSYEEQQNYDPTGKTIAIWNGRRFPGTRALWLKIGQCLVRGRFTHRDPEFSGVGYFKVAEVVHPKTCDFTGRHCTELVSTLQQMFPYVEYGKYQSLANMEARAVWQEGQSPQDLPSNILDPNAVFMDQPPSNWPRNRWFTSSWADQMIGQIRGSRAGFAWIESGSPVRIAYSNPVEFVLSIIPCELLRLAAYRTYAGQRHLATIPPKWYTVEDRDYGDGLVATIIQLVRPLDMLINTGFEGQLYATVRSSVGPNVVDVIQYLVEKYLPDTVCDVTTFAEARAATDDWPVNFALLDRFNIIQLLSSICYQACLGIWFSEGVVYLRYLPNMPAEAVDLTDDSIDAKTLSVGYTPTEEVVTKIVGTYRPSYDLPQPYRLAGRYNISKYGTVEQSTDYFIYNDRDSVAHSITFWLLRKANTWKYLEFTTSLDTLVLETMDAVRVTLRNNFAAHGAVTGIVEKTEYDSETFTLSYRVWLPVRAGEMTTYKFAYYNIGNLYDEFPEPVDWATGNGLGPPILRDLRNGNQGPYVVVDWPNHMPEPEARRELRAVRKYPKAPRASMRWDYYGAEFEAVDGGYGDHPGSYGIEPPDIYTPGDLSDEFQPRDVIGGPIADAPAAITGASISLQQTLIQDEVTGNVGVLASFFRNINSGSELQMLPIVRVSQPQDAGDGEFEIKPVPGSEFFGAKYAFLSEQ